VIANCSMASASCNNLSARSCKSRPSGVNVSERVVLVNSDSPRRSLSRCTLLLTADGEMESDRAAAV
jgi:hypothetical protein